MRTLVWVVIFLTALVPLMLFVVFELAAKVCLWVVDQIMDCMDKLPEESR